MIPFSVCVLKQTINRLYILTVIYQTSSTHSWLGSLLELFLLPLVSWGIKHHRQAKLGDMTMQFTSYRISNFTATCDFWKQQRANCSSAAVVSLVLYQQSWSVMSGAWPSYLLGFIWLKTNAALCRILLPRQ